MRTAIRRRHLPTAAAGVAALALSLLPLAPAAAQTVESRGIARACPGDIGDAFTDDEGSVHEDAINCIAAFEIAQGTGGTSYSPDQPVTRAQMASFIARTMQVAGYEFPADAPDAFDDDDDSVHEGNIDRLAAVGVVAGTGDRAYSPLRPVTRAQMATFINNALGEVTGARPSTTEDFFTDDDGSDHEANINALASIGVVTGVGGGRYDPQGDVRRAAMASFIARGADYLAEKGFWPVPPGGGFTVTPSGADVVELGDSRTFLVQVENDRTLDVRLFHARALEVDAFGKPTFPDADDDDLADEESSTGLEVPAVITQVNGADVAATQEVNDLQTSGGQLTFTITSDEATEVVPVVWEETVQEDDRIDLFVSDEPREPVALGGTTTFVPQEATAAQSTPTVDFEDLANDLFVSTSERTYYWDANDVFQYRGEDIKLSEFEAMINRGDILNVSYESDAGQRSTFNITTDEVHQPDAPTATVVNADDESQADDVLVEFTFPVFNSAGTTYLLQRAPADCATRQGSPLFSTIAEVEESPYLDANRDPGCYWYRLRAVSPVSENAENSPGSNVVQTPQFESDDEESPRINDVRATTDNGPDDAGDPNGVVDTGDEHRFRFNEAMHESTESGTYRISDADGTVVDIICAGEGKNATCDRNEAPLPDSSGIIARHSQLDVVLTATPALVEGGGDGVMEYPAVIINVSSHFQDTNGNQLTLRGSDTTIEVP